MATTHQCCETVQTLLKLLIQTLHFSFNEFEHWVNSCLGAKVSPDDSSMVELISLSGLLFSRRWGVQNVGEPLGRFWGSLRRLPLSFSSSTWTTGTCALSIFRKKGSRDAHYFWSVYRPYSAGLTGVDCTFGCKM